MSKVNIFDWIGYLLYINNRQAPTKKLRAYGMVNKWLRYNDIPSYVKTVKDCGCNAIHVEFLGLSSPYPDDGGLKSIDDTESKFKKLISWARYFDIIVFVNIINWNLPEPVQQSDAWFQKRVDYFKNLGKGNLIVQACCEWMGSRNRSPALDAKAARWCQMCEAQLGGFSLSWNKASRPTSASGFYKYIDYHSMRANDKGGSDKRTITTTDTTSILNEMNGGLMGQSFDPNKVKAYATSTIQSGKSVSLYGFVHNNPDQAGMKALGSI